jgi:hypothetical protein
MKRGLFLTVLLCFATSRLVGQTSDFTYQGRLQDGSGPASGKYQFQFILRDPATNQFGVTKTPVLDVTNGLFNMTFDWPGELFDGRVLLLETSVRPYPNTNGQPYTLLLPRQEITSTPYATKAYSAGTVTGPITDAQLSSNIPRLDSDAVFHGAVQLDNATGNFSGNVGINTNNPQTALHVVGMVTATAFSGALNASNLTGTVSDARLSTNVIFRTNANFISEVVALNGLRLNNSNLWLRAGSSEGLGWYGSTKLFGPFGTNSSDDGPVLFGFNGGALGTTRNAQAISLDWDNSGNVSIRSDLSASRLNVGTNNTLSGTFSSVGGGSGNKAINTYAVVGGGSTNSASGSNSTVSGGTLNKATGAASIVAGGETNTASGIDASLLGGYSNTASGNYSAIAGGVLNIASGARSFVAGGEGADASHYGQFAQASGKFAIAGDAQSSTYVLRRVVSGATPTELLLDGLNQRMTLNTNTTWAFEALVSARSSGGNAAGYKITGLIKTSGANALLVGTPSVVVLGEDISAWDAVAVADNTNGANLVIRVTGTAPETIRWVATVRTTEVTY